MSQYVDSGYLEQGYVGCDGAPVYVEGGYVVDDYTEECDNINLLATFAVSYCFQKGKELTRDLITYLFSAQKTLYTAPAPYLYDNQLSLDPIRIVREKIS